MTRSQQHLEKLPLGGVIHTYQKYDPQNLPSPRQPAPDVVSGAFEHLLAYGDFASSATRSCAGHAD